MDEPFKCWCHIYLRLYISSNYLWVVRLSCTGKGFVHCGEVTMKTDRKYITIPGQNFTQTKYLEMKWVYLELCNQLEWKCKLDSTTYQWLVHIIQEQMLVYGSPPPPRCHLSLERSHRPICMSTSQWMRWIMQSKRVKQFSADYFDYSLRFSHTDSR